MKISENEMPIKSELRSYYPASWECLDGPHPRIKKIVRYPEKLLRSCRKNIFGKNVSADELIAETNRLKKELAELESFGVRVPRRDFLIGKNEAGENTILTTIDHVRGKNLEKADAAENGKNLLTEGCDLCLSLVNYLTSKTRNYQPYLWDVFHYKQYMYGRTENDVNDHIYMVDVEPLYWQYDNIICGYACTEISLWNLMALVNLLELKTSQNLKKIRDLPSLKAFKRLSGG